MYRVDRVSVRQQRSGQDNAEEQACSAAGALVAEQKNTVAADSGSVRPGGGGSGRGGGDGIIGRGKPKWK